MWYESVGDGRGEVWMAGSVRRMDFGFFCTYFCGKGLNEKSSVQSGYVIF